MLNVECSCSGKVHIRNASVRRDACLQLDSSNTFVSMHPMLHRRRVSLLFSLWFCSVLLASACANPADSTTSVRRAVAHDVSPPLAVLMRTDTDSGEARDADSDEADEELPSNVLAPQSAGEGATNLPPTQMAAAPGSGAVEQTTHGTKPAPKIIASFDGLGEGFTGPQGTGRFRNPSDNTLAVGPDHIVQIVNSRMAIFTKKGRRYDTTGKVLYGPVPTNNLFRGFGGPCELRNNGDAVARYDQLA